MLPCISLLQSMGTTVTATSSEASSAMMIVRQKSPNMMLARPSVSAMGRNTSTVVTVDATIARKTSPVPYSAASLALPIFMRVE